MADEKLTPERAVRLLRAKGAELETQVAADFDAARATDDGALEVTRSTFLAADIALVAQLLADHIEWTPTPNDEGYLNAILEVTEFDVGSKEEADYVAALKAECDAYLGNRQP